MRIPLLAPRSQAIALLFAAFVVVSPCDAQRIVEKGDLVRVRILSAESRRMEIERGVVRAFDSGHLVIKTPDGARSERLAFTDIISVERGAVDGTYQRFGAALGFLGLGTATAALGFALYEPSSTCDYSPGCSGAGVALISVSLLGGMVGILLGSIIGARHEKTSWRSVRLPATGTDARAHINESGRSAIALRLTF